MQGKVCIQVRMEKEEDANGKENPGPSTVLIKRFVLDKVLPVLFFEPLCIK